MAATITNVNDIATLGGLEGIFENIITAVLSLAGIVLFLILFYGGFQYITSGGDPKKAEAARSTLTAAIVGLVLVAAAYLFLVFIEEITGAEILNFKIIP